MSVRTESIIDNFIGAIKESKEKTSPYDSPAEVLRIDGDTVWVHIAGGVNETPVRRTVNCAKGDTVQIRVSGGDAWVVGNATSPPTDDTKAYEAINVAQNADYNAERAKQSADQAEYEAQRAYEYADEVQGLAEEASRQAGIASTNAQEAIRQAGIATQSASDAQASASQAQASADQAQASADTADAKAEEAKTSANQAKASAENATYYANSALTELGIVEDVVGTLNWISEHGTYKASTDTEVVGGKYYFTRTGSGTTQNPYVYTVVPNPTGNPATNHYYELDSIDQAVSNYVSSHLALTNEGLWVLNDNNSYKILLSSTGMKVYDSVGSLVATFGESISFSSNRTQYIGNNDCYVAFNPANGGTLTIGGATIQMGNQTLEQVLGQKANSSDIPTAVSDLNNDTGFITSSSLPTNVSDLTNDAGYATTTQVATAKGEAISTASADATSKANQAESNAVATASADATNKANDAKKYATNFLASDSSGIMIYDGTGGTQTPTSPSSTTKNVFIDSDSVDVRQGTTVLATFGANGTQLGQNGQSHALIDYQTFKLIDKENSAYLNFGDLRDSQGVAQVKDTFVVKERNTVYNLSLTATDTSYTVKYEDGTNVSNIAKLTNMFQFYAQSVVPPENTIIIVEYTTNDENAKSFTIGTRDNDYGKGAYSFAHGQSVSAQGIQSHAEGVGAKALGNYSHAEGTQTKAIGVSTHVEGLYTTAFGNYSHAEGEYTTAKGVMSKASGYYTNAIGIAQTVIGTGNVEDEILTNSYHPYLTAYYGKYALIIGNGNNNTRSNALCVDWRGDVLIALDTTATDGVQYEQNDYDLYSAITALGWGNDVIV